MTALNPILSTHVLGAIGTRDLVFARLGAFAEDPGGTLCAIARLCGLPRMAELLAALNALHRTPDGDDDGVIGEAIAILTELRDLLAALPVEAEIRAPIREEDRTLVRDLDAAIRYAGARTEDHIAALNRLWR